MLPPPFAPVASVLNSSLRLNDIQSSIDSLRDISITGLDGFANAPARLQGVAQQRIEPRRVDVTSPLSFALTELNDVLNGSLVLHRSISSNISKLPFPSQNHTGFGLLAQEDFQVRADLKEPHSEIFPINSSSPSTDGLFSILTSASMMPTSLKGEPSPNWVSTEWGNIRIDCTTNPASGGNPEGILGNIAKLTPGWFSNVNWSDDDNDGWNPASTKTTTADPNATYTPDKDDTSITNGDPDLRKFKVYVSAHNNMGEHDWSFKLTFGANVAVYETNTKAGVVPNNKIFTTGELITEALFTKSKTSWLEGQTASAAFRDSQIHVDYVGGNIPMLCTFDTVNVTVFGVTHTGKFIGPQQDDNEARFTDPGFETRSSYDENGQISWDLPRYLNEPPEGYGSYWCKYFHDCIEIQGTVSPPRDANPSQYYGWTNDGNFPAPNPLPAPLVGFSYFQQVYGSTWTKLEDDPIWSHTGPYGIPGEWIDDEPEDIAQSVRPSLTKHIYMIDGPGVETRDRSVDYVQRFRNFRSSTFISFYGVKVMCSDWYRWHSVMFLKPKDSEYLTRAPNTQAKTFQDFGSGWFNIPTVADPTDPLTW